MCFRSFDLRGGINLDNHLSLSVDNNRIPDELNLYWKDMSNSIIATV